MQQRTGSQVPALLTPSLGMVPRSFKGSVFDRYKRREGVAAMGAMVTGAIGLPALMLGAGVLLGASAAVVVGAAELVGFLFAVNRLAALGHRRFQRDLAGRVQGGEGAWFVGLGGPDMNTAQAQFFTPRLDTDDNVGFLRTDETSLHVITEEASVVIPRDAIRSITAERLVCIPTQPLIALAWNDDVGTHRVYVVSREGRSLLQHRKRTLELLEHLQAWHGEHVDRFLEAEMGLSFSR